jgi:hypothetical protein
VYDGKRPKRTFGGAAGRKGSRPTSGGRLGPEKLQPLIPEAPDEAHASRDIAMRPPEGEVVRDPWLAASEWVGCAVSPNVRHGCILASRRVNPVHCIAEPRIAQDATRTSPLA